MTGNNVFRQDVFDLAKPNTGSSDRHPEIMQKFTVDISYRSLFVHFDSPQ